MRDMAWKDAILQVLQEAGEPLRYTDIAEKIIEKGLRTSIGVTPARTVNSIVSVSMQENPASPFVRLGKGLFGLKPGTTSLKSPSRNARTGRDQSDDAAEEAAQGIVRALGMFWLRDNVHWKPNPSIFGRQQIGAKHVDFSGQRGVYLLHDRREVVYVGRSVDRPLGQRLYEHTIDRLNGRWDRFSWFGFFDIDDSGTLIEQYSNADGQTIVAAMEAVLIEALEPVQNRRRGDNLKAIEFIQARDPEIDRRHTKDLLQQVMAKLDGKQD